jgi:predicted GNAT superfamily acetyltransferase
MAEIEIRDLSSMDELTSAARLIDAIWGEQRIMTPALLRALSTHGNPVIGAFRGEELVGAQVGFLGMEEGRAILHSHITGVSRGLEHRGVGLDLKRAQRDWCLAHGIDTVTWTFDPMVARNAYFNLVKLGAVADRFHRDFYGEMEDELNAGDRSDRLEVRWELGSDRVKRALAGEAHEPGDEGREVVRVPEDYPALRQRDPGEAARWRDSVADALEGLFEKGYRATWFRREGAYILERA